MNIVEPIVEYIVEYVRTFLSDHGEKKLLDVWEIHWRREFEILQRKPVITINDINRLASSLFGQNLNLIEHNSNKLLGDWAYAWAKIYPYPPLFD
jgi:hypothetical protein